MKLISRVTFDLFVNIAMLSTCVVLVAGVVHNYRSTHSVVAASGPPSIKAGERAAVVPGLSYADAQVTLVLHVRSSCQYCTKSMAFYRRINDVMKRHAGTRFVVVGAEPQDVLRRYLSENSVSVDRVITDAGHPQPTPTLVLVDSKGLIRDSWLGMQEPAGEERLFRQLDTEE